MKSSFNKTAMAAAVAGTLLSGGTARADLVYLSWTGAFTMLQPNGAVLRNVSSDYYFGYYADGSGDQYSLGAPTTHGWIGYRTPVSGTLAFDVSNGAGVATVNPFMFFGDTPGTGPGSSTISVLSLTVQTIDTAGTMVGTMLFDWKGHHSVSMVLDAAGLFAGLDSMLTEGPTSTISGVGALPASNGIKAAFALGPSPVATKTTNALGCEARPLATQVNAYTIVSNFTNLGMCTFTNDTVGGSPMVSPAFMGYNANFDIMSLHLESPLLCLPDSCPPPPVPVPPAIWLFGSGLLGLAGLARHKRNRPKGAAP